MIIVTGKQKAISYLGPIEILFREDGKTVMISGYPCREPEELGFGNEYYTYDLYGKEDIVSIVGVEDDGKA